MFFISLFLICSTFEKVCYGKFDTSFEDDFVVVLKKADTKVSPTMEPKLEKLKHFIKSPENSLPKLSRSFESGNDLFDCYQVPASKFKILICSKRNMLRKGYQIVITNDFKDLQKKSNNQEANNFQKKQSKTTEALYSGSFYYVAWVPKLSFEKIFDHKLKWLPYNQFGKLVDNEQQTQVQSVVLEFVTFDLDWGIVSEHIKKPSLLKLCECSYCRAESESAYKLKPLKKQKSNSKKTVAKEFNLKQDADKLKVELEITKKKKKKMKTMFVLHQLKEQLGLSNRLLDDISQIIDILIENSSLHYSSLHFEIEKFFKTDKQCEKLIKLILRILYHSNSYRELVENIDAIKKSQFVEDIDATKKSQSDSGDVNNIDDNKALCKKEETVCKKEETVVRALLDFLLKEKNKEKK